MDEYGNKDVFSRNLKKYFYASGKTAKEVCKDLHVAESSFSGWLNGNVYPRMEKIDKLAQYFGIARIDLIYSEKPPESKTTRTTIMDSLPPEIKNELQEISQLYPQLNREEQIRTMERMKTIVELTTKNVDSNTKKVGSNTNSKITAKRAM